MVSKTAVAGVDVERTLFKLVEARFLVGLSSERLLVCLQKPEFDKSVHVDPSFVYDEHKQIFTWPCIAL